MTLPLRLLPCAALLLLSAACASDPAEAPSIPGAGGDSSEGGTPGTTPLDCPSGPQRNGAPDPIEVGTVTARFVDEHGEPALVGRVQICGIDICRDATTNTSAAGELVKVMSEAVDAPACKFGDGLDWAELLVPITAGDNDLGTLVTARLPDLASAERFAPGRRVSSNGMTLTLAEDAYVETNTLDYETDEQQMSFRAVELPADALSQLQQDFVVAFGVSPLETTICPNPKLTMENNTALPPGTELELYILGLNAAGRWAAYGTWHKVGEGRVSDDGASLDFADGVPVLSAIGVRVKK